MGCQPAKDAPKESLLLEKEKKLGRGKYTIKEIKQVERFFS
jgi:hypothetical protein